MLKKKKEWFSKSKFKENFYLVYIYIYLYIGV